jgi:glycosyltransferase involved in cell wall biosynthesis
VELYVGGRFAIVHALLCRLTRIPLLVVERGDLLMCQRRVYGRMTRMSVYGCYALATRIWYKEPYMAEFFRRRFPRRSTMLPNGVPLAEPSAATEPRDIDLLWVNRVIPERHPDWFARALAARSDVTSAFVLGFADEDAQPERVSRLEREVRTILDGLAGVVCLPFCSPEPFFGRSRFFVLPADVVFGNYALLEAMSHGVVPVVSASAGVELVVVDGVNGIVCRHDENGLADGLTRALNLSVEQWQEMSHASIEVVRSRFSLEVWGRQLLALYAELDPHRNDRAAA